jgi:hypothetical protein
VTELLLRPLADAFMQVGVFIALLSAPFGWARWRHGARLDALLVRHSGLAPLVAAAMTMPPGCGGAIIVMALYARGAVSYGAAIAALVATMGDASWVLLAGDPWLTVRLKALLLVTGALTGYAVDALGVAPRRKIDLVAVSGVPALTAVGAGSGSGSGSDPHVDGRPPTGATSGGGAARTAGGPRLATVLPTTLWVLLGVGALVSIPVTFQLAVAPDDLYLLLGVLGAVACLVVFLHGRCRLADDTGPPPTSMYEVLRDGGSEVAYVTVWVALVYVIWSLVSHLTGFDGSQLPLLGFTGVVVGALVGLIPGCAVQIVFAGLFLAGGVPLPTLAANSVSQDGDALLPLLALEHRSALLATVITTIPALVVGSALYLLG